MLCAPGNGAAVSRHGHLTSLLLRGGAGCTELLQLAETGATGRLESDGAVNAVLQTGES